MSMGIIIAIVAVAAFIIIIWIVSTRNRFERIDVKISEADSGIDVALTKRYDTLTKMRDVAKGYARHEAETLEGIVTLRKGMTIAERNMANRQMDDMEEKLFVMVENYPQLRSSENYLALQETVAEVEEHLQAARRIYNMNVSAFNQLLASWPASVVGSGRGYSPKEFFEADGHKRHDVEMGL